MSTTVTSLLNSDLALTDKVPTFPDASCNGNPESVTHEHCALYPFYKNASQQFSTAPTERRRGTLSAKELASSSVYLGPTHSSLVESRLVAGSHAAVTGRMIILPQRLRRSEGPLDPAGP